MLPQLFVLFGLLTTSACQAAGHQPTDVAATAEATPPTMRLVSDDDSVLRRLPDMAERAVGSVVNISTETVVELDQRLGPLPFRSPFFEDFFGPRLQPELEAPRPHRQQGRGSGVIVDDDGIILTNHHVVGDADEIDVTLADGRTFDATVVGSDARSDLAVVKLEDPPSDLVPLPYGDSDALRLGEFVLAIGNPFGVGQTVTMGIVSATGRADLGIVDYEDFIQTDAAINPGNSGGALVNLAGELVGINTAIMSRSGGYQGIGFAIPSAMARRIAEELLDDGKVDRGFLGVMIQDLRDDLRSAMELDDVEGGVLVSDVTPDSAADEAGFRRGDVVLEFNGEAMRSASDLRMAVADAGSGKRFTAVVLRDGRKKKLTGRLHALEDEAPAGPGHAKGATTLGVQVEELTDAVRERLGVPERVSGGVVVARVEASSEAQRAGLRTGDLVLEVDRRRVDSPRAFHDAVEDAGDKVLMLVMRGNATRYVVLRK